MRKIHRLSSKIISKIAAGEVIERPAFAVKELVENAIDAGANSISVQIIDAGLKKIIVNDNGSGMSREDLEESVKLHTTSKLVAEEDLAHIETLGFRGEALASIAAISHITIQSRTMDDVTGMNIDINDGILVKISPVGRSVGTTVIVSNLFHSVPGRRKFLKSMRTEARLIIDLLTQFGLAHPEIHFSLQHNNKPIFDLPKVEKLDERISFLFGPMFASNLLPLFYQTSYITIKGFIGKPQAASFSAKQYLFVNGRMVANKLITNAVKETFSSLIDPKSHPAFLLFLSLPYDLVDVNVHPRKEEIRFVDDQLLYETVQKAINQTLSENNLLYYADTIEGVALGDKPNFAWRSGTTKSFAGRVLKENQIPWDIRPVPALSLTDISQFHNLYLLTQTKYGIAFVDQHAAHERILYEQFLEAFKKEKADNTVFYLSNPTVVEMSYTESELVKEHQMLFTSLGFVIEHFKDNTFLLHAVPLVLQDRKPLPLIHEILADLAEEKNIKEVDRVSNRMIAYLACRAAVKAGEHLTKKQCKDLLEKLEKTNNNTTCPHGRPTKVIMDIDKLHKMFKRK